MMLGTPVDNVVVRIYAGPGHYGRSNGGNAGAEDEAVILSKAVGRPVRVQWMRPDDLQWSTQSPPGISNIRIGWDASGKITAYQADHYMPAMQDDRLVGALLAGLPTPPPPDVTRRGGLDRFDGERRSRIRGSTTGCRTSPSPDTERFSSDRRRRRWPSVFAITACGRRGSCSRTIPRELAISEAAALAGIDAIEFRLQTDRRSAADRRAEGGSRGVGMADPSVAEPESGRDRDRRRCRARACR